MKLFPTKAVALILLLAGSTITAHAEDGSERLANFRLQNDAMIAERSTVSIEERVAQIMETQPTASGPQDNLQWSESQGATNQSRAAQLKTRDLHRSQK
ncbi:TPA: hypothetical protein L4Q87_000786 [Pseudomonas aeruginosa]|uniref:hypothetical protein n=1 Tax=Pseudomonas aeruginosa TaxID=287 RepID=UPI00259E6051|nr:hypothetical protein [Pseudomonas aeruginosa]HBO2979808.1 hypothetical protein [Pseudomonas aeruginosa]